MPNATSPYRRFFDNQLGLRELRCGSAGGVRLIAFPHAGGQSLAFRTLADALPSEWSIWGVDLPGHGWADGTPREDIAALAAICAEHLPRELLEGAVLLGHSLGGCIAFQLSTLLAAEGRRPRALVLSAARPPHRTPDYVSFVDMDDATLLRSLISIGGLPADWSNEPELFDCFKRAIRADLVAFEHFQISEPLVGVPTLILAGVKDMVSRPEHAFEWAQYCRECRVELIGEGHQFVETHAAWVAGRMASFVASASASPTRF